jgi:hypothetical protein
LYLYIFTESTHTNDDRTQAATSKDVEITRTTSTTIKFKTVRPFYSKISPAAGNKCWFKIYVNEEGTSLYLLNDSNVITKVVIGNQYILYPSITTNEEGEAVWCSDRSVMAATQDGTIYKLFEVPSNLYPFIFMKICFLQSGNYLMCGDDRSELAHSCFHECSKYGALLHTNLMPLSLDAYPLHIAQNNNGDIVITTLEGLFIYNNHYSLKHKVPLPERGVVVPCMNSGSELLYGHKRTIDLLNSDGQFVKTVYTARKDKQIENIAISRDGTSWILYDSHEVDILKLEI